jgi:hypothetical protein
MAHCVRVPGVICVEQLPQISSGTAWPAPLPMRTGRSRGSRSGARAPARANQAKPSTRYMSWRSGGIGQLFWSHNQCRNAFRLTREAQAGRHYMLSKSPGKR